MQMYDNDSGTGEAFVKVPEKLSGVIQQWLGSFSVRAQLMIVFGVLMTSLTLTTLFIVNSELTSSGRHQADSIGQLLSEQTASATVDMLVTGDRLSLNILLSQLVQNPYVAEATIYSIDNQRIARASSQKTSEGGKGPQYSAPIHYQDVIAGYVRLYLNEGLLSQKPKDALMVIIAIGLLLLLTGFIFLHLYSSTFSTRLGMIERQLFTIFPGSKAALPSNNEIARLSAFVEHQLTEKWAEKEQAEETSPSETSAILAIRAKNLGRLKQFLTPKDLQEILRQYSTVIDRAARFYEGEVTYTPEGNAYIRFCSQDNEEFSVDALSCSLMIEALLASAGEHEIARIHLGAGLSFSDELSEFPEEKHPALSDSAASQALHLANISEPDGLHMFHGQLSWLPADLPDLQISEFDEGIVQIKGLNGEMAELLQNQIIDIQNELF